MYIEHIFHNWDILFEFYYFLRFIFILSVFDYMYICAPSVCIPGACRGQKGVPILLELELQKVVSQHTGPGNLTRSSA